MFSSSSSSSSFAKCSSIWANKCCASELDLPLIGSPNCWGFDCGCDCWFTSCCCGCCCLFCSVCIVDVGVVEVGLGLISPLLPKPPFKLLCNAAIASLALSVLAWLAEVSIDDCVRCVNLGVWDGEVEFVDDIIFGELFVEIVNGSECDICNAGLEGDVELDIIGVTLLGDGEFNEGGGGGNIFIDCWIE